MQQQPMRYALVIWPPPATEDDIVHPRMIGSHLPTLTKIGLDWNRAIVNVEAMLSTPLARCVVCEWPVDGGSACYAEVSKFRRLLWGDVAGNPVS